MKNFFERQRILAGILIFLGFIVLGLGLSRGFLLEEEGAVDPVFSENATTLPTPPSSKAKEPFRDDVPAPPPMTSSPEDKGAEPELPSPEKPPEPLPDPVLQSHKTDPPGEAESDADQEEEEIPRVNQILMAPEPEPEEEPAPEEEMPMGDGSMPPPPRSSGFRDFFESGF